jgi:hypothetical protein
MKLRRREAVWLLALGGLLLVVRGMDSRTASLRHRASAVAERVAGTGAPATAMATASPAAPGDGDPGALISTADLATMAWGPNPFRGGATRRDDVAFTDRSADEGSAASATPAAPRVPRFRGLVTVKGRTLAALDGEFLAPGERIGDWLVQEIGSGGVTVRQVRTGEMRRLSRERTASAP